MAAVAWAWWMRRGTPVPWLPPAAHTYCSLMAAMTIARCLSTVVVMLLFACNIPGTRSTWATLDNSCANSGNATYCEQPCKAIIRGKVVSSHCNGEWVLLLSSTLSGAHFRGSFDSSGSVGQDLVAGFASTEFRINATGAELQSLGPVQMRVMTGHFSRSHTFGGNMTNLNALDSTCTSCNCRGASLGGSIYWHGGRGNCHGGSHFGVSENTDDVHIECQTNGCSVRGAHQPGCSNSNGWYGHFHRHSVNTGVYGFDNTCISEIEWNTQFSFWIKQPGWVSADSCAEGFYRASNDTSKDCVACAPGSVTDTLGSPGAVACTACTPGQYSPTSSVACADCPAGSVVDTLDAAGGTTCTACAPGRFSNSSRSRCQTCQEGFYTNTLAQPGAQTCIECQHGMKSLEPTVACSPDALDIQYQHRSKLLHYTDRSTDGRSKLLRCDLHKLMMFVDFVVGASALTNLTAAAELELQAEACQQLARLLPRPFPITDVCSSLANTTNRTDCLLQDLANLTRNTSLPLYATRTHRRAMHASALSSTVTIRSDGTVSVPSENNRSVIQNTTGQIGFGFSCSEDIDLLEMELTVQVQGVPVHQLAAPSKFWVSLGTGNAQEACVPSAELHDVRCCADTVISGWSHCSAGGRSVWAETDNLVGGAAIGGWQGCYKDVNHQSAAAACARNGARLCTLAEIGAGCSTGTGCGFNSQQVWTSTPCGLVAPAGLPHSELYHEVQADGSGWSHTEITDVGSAGLMHGPWGSNNRRASKDIQLPSGTSQCTVSWRSWAVYTRDGEHDYATIDGIVVWKKRAYHSGCRDGWLTGPRDFPHSQPSHPACYIDVEVTVPCSGGSLRIEFSSDVNQHEGDESWGFQHLKVVTPLLGSAVDANSSLWAAVDDSNQSLVLDIRHAGNFTQLSVGQQLRLHYTHNSTVRTGAHHFTVSARGSGLGLVAVKLTNTAAARCVFAQSMNRSELARYNACSGVARVRPQLRNDSSLTTRNLSSQCATGQ